MILAKMLLTSLLFTAQDHAPKVCLSPEIALSQAKALETAFREPVKTNDFVVDKRIQQFKAFNKSCLSYLFNQNSNHDNQKKHLLFNAVKKSYFYSRDKEVLEQYIDYLNKAGNGYEQALTFAKNEIGSFSFGQSQKRLTLSNNGAVKQFDGTDTLLIISSPNCRFSKTLKTWIRDENIHTDQNVVWGVKPPVGFNSKDFLNNPNYNDYTLLVNVADWAEIPLWSTPIIYHYRDGQIVKQVIGFNDSTKQYLKNL